MDKADLQNGDEYTVLCEPVCFLFFSGLFAE